MLPAWPIIPHPSVRPPAELDEQSGCCCSSAGGGGEADAVTGERCWPYVDEGEDVREDVCAVVVRRSRGCGPIHWTGGHLSECSLHMGPCPTKPPVPCQ